MYFDSKNTSRKLQLLHSECMSKTRDFPLKKPQEKFPKIPKSMTCTSSLWAAHSTIKIWIRIPEKTWQKYPSFLLLFQTTFSENSSTT